MHYSFHAAEQDKIEIFEYIFNETDLRVFQLNSSVNQEIKRFKSVDDILQHDPETFRSSWSYIGFTLWSERLGQGHKSGEPKSYKTTFNEEMQKEGKFFSYRFTGLGVINIGLGGIQRGNQLYQSEITHITKERALGQKVAKEMKGDVCHYGWNWKEIYSTARKLKSHIHNKMSVIKFMKSNDGVLQHAYNEVKDQKLEIYPPWKQNKFIKSDFIKTKL